MRLLLYIAFFVSGAAGLLYEIVWSRYLALFVGHSAYAQVLVIAVYLGGLAAGALAAGERCKKLTRPLYWYALAEGVLAVFGFAFHFLYQAGTGVAYDTLLPALGASPWSGAARWAIAVAMIAPQAFLLGTTFPLMAAGVMRAFPERPGGTIANLYFTNSIGAAAGTLLGGFVFLALAGLPGTAGIAGVLNLVAGAVALAVGARIVPGVAREVVPGAVPEAAPEAVPPAAVRDERLWGGLLVLSFGTAVASFIYEIGWIRLLSLVLGSATHSFEIMLSAFILGLALGALLARRFADTARRPLRLLGLVQWFMGLTALGTLPVYLFDFNVMAVLIETLPRTDEGYALFSVAKYGMALAVMLPSTILAGMTLPLITSLLLHSGAGERAVGWVYSVNTIGSMIGVVGAALILMPLLGVKGMLVAGAVVDMGLGVWLLGWAARREGARALRDEGWIAPGAGIVTVTAVVGVLVGIPLNPAVLTSGVFRFGHVPDEERSVLFYEDGRTATVGAHVLPGDRQVVVLTTNGKPDASLEMRWIRAATETLPPRPIQLQDEATQLVASLVMLAHAPEARTGALIGHGSGISAHYLLGSPVLEELVTVEIEPRMIRGSQVYYPANRRTFDDPRHSFVIDDAKAYFAYQQDSYDLILSEPSNPWVSGVAGLFTVEFYDRIQDYLTEGGVFGQWMQLYEISDQLLLTVLAALHESFPSYRAYLIGDTDLLIVASGEPGLPDPDWSVLELPDIQDDLSHVTDFTADLMEATWLFGRPAMAPLLDGWPILNSDFRPVLDLGTERTRFLQARAQGTYGLALDRFDLAGALQERRVGFGPYSTPPVSGIAPMQVRGLSNWLQEASELPTGELPFLATPSSAHTRALGDFLALEQQLRGDDPPRSWRGWTNAVIASEHDLHGETAGTADSAFYARVRGYLDRMEPPDEAHRVIDFLHGLAVWDFQEAAEAGNRLVRGRAAPTWLEPGLLLDGTVVANLKVGDPSAARAAYQALTPLTDREPGDLRNRLLSAHIEAAEAGG